MFKVLWFFASFNLFKINRLEASGRMGGRRVNPKEQTSTPQPELNPKQGCRIGNLSPKSWSAGL